MSKISSDETICWRCNKKSDPLVNQYCLSCHKIIHEKWEESEGVNALEIARQRGERAVDEAYEGNRWRYP